MATPLSLESPLWKKFEQAARQRRRNPAQLLKDYMRECLEIWEDQQLDEGISDDLKRSGCAEEDAVKLVREHRKRKRP